MATVNSILKKSDNGRFLFHAFLGEQFNVDDPKKCRCLNRFYSDTKADVIFFEGKGGRWRFHDHGDSSFSGDVFEYAKWHFDLHDDSDFPELLKQCDALLKKYLNGEGSKFKDFKPIRTKAKAVERKKREFSIEKIAFTNEGLAFWEQSGVTKDVLTEHGVCQINGFSETDEYGEVKVVDLKDSDVCFAYQFPGFVKLYFPMRKEYRYQFLGNKTKDYSFGSALLDNDAHGMDLIVAAGERDVLTLIANGFHAICFSSETAKVPRRFTKELYEAGYNFHCLYDNDKTGRRESLRLAQSGFNSLNPFDSLNRGQRRRVKDVTDFVIGGHDLKTEVNRLLYGEAKVSEKNGDQIYQIFQILQPSSEAVVTDSAFDRRIYDQLPPLMTDVVKGYGDRHIKDAVLFSSLITMGSITTNVRGKYFGKMVPTNLYGYVLGGASGGKSQISVAKKLVEPIHQRLFEESISQIEQYKQLSIEKQKKKKRPKFRQFIVPANVSASALAHYLDANDGQALMFEEEADTLTSVMSQEWGDISIALRKGAEGEPYALGRVSLDIPIYLKNIHISFVFSSTHNQLKRMIPSAENGLLSRILFYELPMKAEFRDPFAEHNTDDGTIREVSSKLMRFWEREANKKFRTEFFLTTSQQAYFHQEFSDAQYEERKANGDSSMMIIRRLGAMTFKIAMILTMIRQMEGKPLGRFIECDDRDFESAILLARYFRKKGIEVLNTYPKVNTSLVSSNQKHNEFFEALPDEFTTKDFHRTAEDIQMKLGTAKERISIWVKDGKLIRTSHGKYKKALN